MPLITYSYIDGFSVGARDFAGAATSSISAACNRSSCSACGTALANVGVVIPEVIALVTKGDLRATRGRVLEGG
jgi:hypothetical protein